MACPTCTTPIRRAAHEEILLYPHPSVRISHKAGDPVQGVASYLNADQLGSVRTITSSTGTPAKQTTYRPFGEAVDFVTSLNRDLHILCSPRSIEH